MYCGCRRQHTARRPPGAAVGAALNALSGEAEQRGAIPIEPSSCLPGYARSLVDLVDVGGRERQSGKSSPAFESPVTDGGYERQ
jgi:hypothetical protein